MTCVNKDGCYLHDTRTPTSKIKKKKKEKKELQTGKMGKKCNRNPKVSQVHRTCWRRMILKCLKCFFSKIKWKLVASNDSFSRKYNKITN